MVPNKKKAKAVRLFLLLILLLSRLPGEVQVESRATGTFAAICQEEVKSILPMLESLEPSIMVDQIKTPEGKSINRTQAKQWIDLAAFALLHGDIETTLYASLKAVQLEPTPPHLTNAGIALLYYGETAKGMKLLNCVQSSGHQSPFLYEAIGSAYVDLGKKDKALEAMQQALALAPENEAIRIEESLLRTGEPPPDGPRCEEDPIPCAWKELVQRIESGLKNLDQFSQFLNRLEGEAGFETPQSRLDDFTELKEHWEGEIAYIKTFVKPGKKKSTRVFNRALEICASFYAMFSHDEMNALTQYASDWLFWADVAGLTSKEYVSTMFQDIKFNFHRAGGELITQLNREANEIITDDAPEWMWSPYLGWGRALGDWDQGHLQAQKDYDAEISNCSDDYCIKRVFAKFCRIHSDLMVEWEGKTTQGFKKAAVGFDMASSRYLIVMRNIIDDALEYAHRVLALRKTKDPSGRPIQGVKKFNQISDLNTVFTDWIPELFNDFFYEKADEYKLRRQFAIMQIEGWKQWLEDCKNAERDLQIANYIRENAQKLLDDTIKQMNEETRPRWRSKPNCTLKIGAYSLQLDLRGGTAGQTVKLGPFRVASKQKGFQHVSARVGVNSSLGVGPDVGEGLGVVGKAGVSVYGSRKENSGLLDYVVELKGAIGLGVKTQGFEAACYPGEVSSVIDLRRLIEHEKLVFQLKEQLANR